MTNQCAAQANLIKILALMDIKVKDGQLRFGLGNSINAWKDDPPKVVQTYAGIFKVSHSPEKR